MDGRVNLDRRGEWTGWEPRVRECSTCRRERMCLYLGVPDRPADSTASRWYCAPCYRAVGGVGPPPLPPVTETRLSEAACRLDVRALRRLLTHCAAPAGFARLDAEDIDRLNALADTLDAELDRAIAEVCRRAKEPTGV